MTTLGIGVIGLGRMGGVYASFIAQQVEGAKLVAVADSRAEATEKFTQKVSGLKAYSTYEALLKDPDVQGVVITTPTSTHREIVIAAAQAGKAIFCEKPTALTCPKRMKWSRQWKKRVSCSRWDSCAVLTGVTWPQNKKLRKV